MRNLCAAARGDNLTRAIQSRFVFARNYPSPPAREIAAALFNRALLRPVSRNPASERSTRGVSRGKKKYGSEAARESGGQRAFSRRGAGEKTRGDLDLPAGRKWVAPAATVADRRSPSSKAGPPNCSVEIRPLLLPLSVSRHPCPIHLCHYHRPEETRRSTSFFRSSPLRS